MANTKTTMSTSGEVCSAKVETSQEMTVHLEGIVHNANTFHGNYGHRCMSMKIQTCPSDLTSRKWHAIKQNVDKELHRHTFS